MSFAEVTTQATKFDNASLILIVEDEQVDQQIWQAVKALGLLRCRVEVILVAGQGSGPTADFERLLNDTITYRPIPKMFPCLKQAIQAATHPLIAIADPGTEIDPEVWKLLAARASQLPIQTAFHASVDIESSKRSQAFKRMQVGSSNLIVRCLLRTRKTELLPGLTMLSREPAGLAEEEVSFQSEAVSRVELCSGNLDSDFAGLALDNSAAVEQGLEPDDAYYRSVKLKLSPEETGIELTTRRVELRSATLRAVSPALDGLQPQQTLTSSTQLLALARLNGCQISETELGTSTSQSASTPNSKQIRRAMTGSIRFWWNTMMFPRHRFELKQQLGESNPKRISSLKQFAIVATLMLIASFCLFQSLGFALFEPDEARNAQLALNVVESGDWMSLKLNQEPYWDKPPLQIWAIATSYQAFGVNQWSTRLPGAIASLLTILMTVLIGKRLVGFRAAAIGTFLLLLTAGFLFTGRYVTMDAALTTTTTATLLLGFLAVRDRFSKSTAVLAGIACGIGVLTKGPIAIVLCLPPLIAASWLLAKQPEQSKTKNRWLWFVVPTCLVAAPWFIATSLVHPDFLTYFFWKHHVVRFSSAFNHREPFWYYAIGIFLFMFPASYLLPSAARFLTSRKPENRLWRTREHGFLLLAVVWIVGFFTLAESKLPTYIVPSFPLICLLMGVLVERKLLGGGITIPGQPRATSQLQPNQRRTFFDGLVRRAPLELVFWIAVGSAVLLTLLPSHSASLISMIGSAGLIGLLSVLAVRKRSKPKLAWACFGLIALFAVGMIVHRIVPAAAEQRSIHIAAQQLKLAPDFENAPLVFFGREPYGSTLIHNPADVKFFKETQTRQLVEFLTANPNAIIVASDDPMKTLRADLPWSIRLDQCETARHLYTSQINLTVAEQSANDAKLRR